MGQRLHLGFEEQHFFFGLTISPPLAQTVREVRERFGASSSSTTENGVHPGVTEGKGLGHVYGHSDRAVL